MSPSIGRTMLCLLSVASVLFSGQTQAQQIGSASSQFVAQTPPKDDQIGFCRKCKHPGKEDCDAAARAKSKKDWDEYARKWKVAQELFAQAAKDLKQVSDQRQKWAKDEGLALAEITGGKGLIIKYIQSKMSQAGAKVLGGASEAFGLYSTYEWLRWDVYPEVRDHNRAMKDAGKEVETAAKLAQEAIEAMKRALAAEAACKDQWAKDDAQRAQQEALVDKAKQLRDTWALDGSPLYKDPNDPSPYPMDAAAALKRAIDILSKQSGSGGSAANSAEYFKTRMKSINWNVTFAIPASQQPSSGGSQQKTYNYTLEQAKAALVQVESAEKIMQDGNALTEKQSAFEESWGGQLTGVLAQWQQSQPQPR